MRWQIVEKDDFGTDWSLVRYDDRAVMAFDDNASALKSARHYITNRNCNNALTKEEKRAAVECWMKTSTGIFLGELDGKDWYLLDREGKHVNEKYYELQGKTQVAVREVPGS